MLNGDVNNGLWTYEQTAIFLGSTETDPISVRSIMRLCQEGKIRRIYPIPKKPRIDPKSVEQYIESLVSEAYDETAQDGGCNQIGAKKWQKSTPVTNPRTGGRDSRCQTEKKLESLLRSQIRRN